MYKSLLTGFFALTLSTAAIADERQAETTQAPTSAPDRLAALEASLAALQSRVVELEDKLESANEKVASLEAGSRTNMSMTESPSSSREAVLEAKIVDLEEKLAEVDARTGWAKAPGNTVAVDGGLGDGNLTVESPNIHGEVWLNGKGTGAFGPVTFKKLTAGVHTVEIKVDGKAVRSAKVKVEESRNRRVVIF